MAVGSTCGGRGVGEPGTAVASWVTDTCLHGIDVCLLLELSYVFLIANPLVAKPVGDLRGGGQKSRVRWEPVPLSTP